MPSPFRLTQTHIFPFPIETEPQFKAETRGLRLNISVHLLCLDTQLSSRAPVCRLWPALETGDGTLRKEQDATKYQVDDDCHGCWFAA